MRRILVLLFLLAGVAGTARAHDRSHSYSSWRLDGREARVVLRLAEIETTRIEGSEGSGAERDERIGAWLTERLRLLAGEDACPIVSGPTALHPGEGRLAFEWRLRCPPEGELTIESEVLLELSPTHLHFVRLRRDGGAEEERVLSARERRWPLPPAGEATGAGSGTTTGGYVLLGIEHILGGYDHLAFVLALLLVGRHLAEVARVVTGFTVAHSLTLGLAALGLLQPASAPIEALIGLSIALVAAENVWLTQSPRVELPIALALGLLLLAVASGLGVGNVPPLTLAGLALFTLSYFGLLRRSPSPGRWRWSVAFLFGLLHGFGFAGVLAEVGLPPDRLGAALFGFNVGVEIGQLGVVAVIWPLLQIATRAHPVRRQRIIGVGSALVAGLGMFWFVSRHFG